MMNKVVSGLILFGLVLVSAEEYNQKGYYGGNELLYSNNEQNYGHYYPKKGAKVETYLKQEFYVPIPQPYPVKIEKKVPVPYPVRVPVHVDNPVPYPVIKPYPVQVEKPVPYPVHKNIPYPVKVPYKVLYPVKVGYPVEKPYPVQVTKHVPYVVKQPYIVEKRVPVYVHESQHHNSGYGSNNGGYGHYEAY